MDDLEFSIPLVMLTVSNFEKVVKGCQNYTHNQLIEALKMVVDKPYGISSFTIRMGVERAAYSLAADFLVEIIDRDIKEEEQIKQDRILLKQLALKYPDELEN